MRVELQENESGIGSEREGGGGLSSDLGLCVCVCFTLSLHMSNGRTGSSREGPRGVCRCFPPLHFQPSKAFFHLALGDDSVGLLRFSPQQD